MPQWTRSTASTAAPRFLFTPTSASMPTPGTRLRVRLPSKRLTKEEFLDLFYPRIAGHCEMTKLARTSLPCSAAQGSQAAAGGGEAQSPSLPSKLLARCAAVPCRVWGRRGLSCCLCWNRIASILNTSLAGVGRYRTKGAEEGHKA